MAYGRHYLDDDGPLSQAPKSRWILGYVAALIVPSITFATALGSRFLDGFGTLLGLGAISILAFFAPLTFWRIPRSRHPLMTSVAIGILSAPGLAYVFILVGLVSLAEGGSGLILFTFAISAPMGALGGLTFWLVALWRPDALVRFARRRPAPTSSP